MFISNNIHNTEWKDWSQNILLDSYCAFTITVNESACSV